MVNIDTGAAPSRQLLRRWQFRAWEGCVKSTKGERGGVIVSLLRVVGQVPANYIRQLPHRNARWHASEFTGVNNRRDVTVHELACIVLLAILVESIAGDDFGACIARLNEH